MSFTRPRRDQVVLRFGAAGLPLHETRIYLAEPERGPVEFPAVESLYVVGDTHGEFNALAATLRAAGFIGDALEWTGGRRQLVFLGDLVDRGPDVTRLLWFVYRLEREAAAAGGHVYVLLGNHELLDLTGDLRYLNPREAAIAQAYGITYDRMLHVRESLLGRWLASKPGAIRIGDVLIVHGGIATDWIGVSLRRLDAMLANFLTPAFLYRDPATLKTHSDSVRYQAMEDFFWHPHSLFWYRDFVQNDQLDAPLDSVLHSFDARVMVVGHTQEPEIEARYGGRLIAAHTVNYGADMLLLVRDHGQLRRFRIGERGQPEPF
ncbi:MAG: hypothetical protein FIB01_02925 [Gemmatimonadetes bacterium]|nr:hypothetical protein [Gemmatimonadota bacterium]